MKYNLNDAAPAERDFTSSREIIPDDTEVTLLVDILRSKEDADNYDEETEGLLTLSKNGDSAFLSLEFTVIGGEFNRRKIWDRLYLRGDSEQAMEISRTKLRAIVEGARGINQTDKSPAAQKKRDVDLSELDKMEIQVVMGVEKSRDDRYPDKNAIKRVVNTAAPEKPSTKVATAKAAPAKKSAGKGWGV